MNYWLFQGNPKYYRIVDAINDLEEMPWLVTRYQKEIALGDGVLVWMAGKEAGIYAIAEIVALPEILTEIPDQNYWLEPQKLIGKTQAKIKFVRKLLGQPLRKNDLKNDQILKDLLVIKAPNGTNFKVTQAQWERVAQIKS